MCIYIYIYVYIYIYIFIKKDLQKLASQKVSL